MVTVSGFLSCKGNRDVLIDVESFGQKGGWCVDQQFMDIMGSPYLLAHGAGMPVPDASMTVELPAAGKWNVYVRTYNWTSPWSGENGPGGFNVLADGDTLQNVCGTHGDSWMWQLAGSFRTDRTEVLIALHDLTGFDGRCDALFLTQGNDAPSDDMASLRHRLIPGYDVPQEELRFDLVVTGGGVAGMCAAVSAARLGLKVAVIHDRYELGGNNSSEVRVHLGGMINLPPYPNLGNLVREFGHTTFGNARDADSYEDWKKEAFIAGEKNITLLRPYHAVGVESDGNHITAVLARHIETGALVKVTAPLFADCTGDASVGVMAGAEYRTGRESRQETGEASAPEKADRQVLGASVQWNSKVDETRSGFPLFDYGMGFNDSSVQHVTMGEWTWETGMLKDMTDDFEQVRDYAMLVVYANWSYLKNSPLYAEEYANRSLDWVAYVAGKRESNRLVGDVVLTQNDIEDMVMYDDASASTSWSIDLHYPDPENTRFFPGREFKAICEQENVECYPIPYRCFYSKNIDNLFMAGRNISVTHVALGTTRVMRTTAMIGEVVGMAAKVCHDNDCLPRTVYTDHLDELKVLMTRGTGRQDLPNNQEFNTGRGK